MRTKRFLCWLIACIVGLSACRSATSGPLVWIDQPLENSVYPPGPVPITAHASDSNGVEAFEFYINGNLAQTLSGGGRRLGEASWQWVAAKEGEYILEVVAFDIQGRRSTAARVVLNIDGISSSSPEEILPTITLEIECLDGLTIAAAVYIYSPQGIESFSIFNTVVQAEHSQSFQEPLPLEIDQTFLISETIPDPIDRVHEWGLEVVVPGWDPLYSYADEPDGRCPGHYAEVESGATSTARTDLVTPLQNVVCRRGPDNRFETGGYLSPDSTVQAIGRLADGSWIQVQVPDQTQPCWIAAAFLEIEPGLLEILPDVNPPPLSTFEPTETPPPLPTLSPTHTTAPDTSPPVISDLDSSPDLILTQSGGCPAYSRTVTVQAQVTDNQSVSTVLVSWSVGGESGQEAMAHIGGNSYQAEIGPVSTTGTLQITVQAQDSAGNTSSAAAPAVSVQNCIE